MPSFYLDNALRLPAPEVEALIQGRSIAVMPRSFLDVGKVFALYPTDVSNNLLPVEQQYRSNFLTVAKNTISELHPEGVIIKAWARCELCQVLDKSESLEVLSSLTIWTTEALQQILAKRPYIFLAYLRVYLLPESLVMSADSQGQFVALPKSINVAENSPVLSDRAFSKRRHQLENRLPPLHPELEELQSAIAQLSLIQSNAEKLDEQLKVFLGWSEFTTLNNCDRGLDWINKIAQVGNSSDGNEFEKLVRKSFIKLGFSNSNKNPKANLDPNSAGGAGGIDLYCELPYPVVGECKASKHENVPNSVTAQLIHLGVTHLGQAQFDRSIKLILAAGPLTDPACKAATQNKMNVIRPETLQRLVELKANYEGSINLLDLKQCLQSEPFGIVDDKVNAYIDRVKQDIKLRSHIVQLVKKYIENTEFERGSVDALHGAYCFGSNPLRPLQPEELHEILVELSSPLTGYLGRKKGSHWRSDRFYYLRDLIIENI
ncbi:DUF1802 family protein [Argonema galeatum]|uniref:DUF1802 family protein n=1 Tax=Argonema galeatum TaxID=2942762 RepID=UPI002013A792|nr:DUF1802 family protein [Argonema galeatum]MCL1463907.1 DUF1802 family protein [Argonema galeatum A003/A1]